MRLTKVLGTLGLVATIAILFTACDDKKDASQVQKNVKVAGQVVKWKIATTWGPDLAPFSSVSINMAAMVKKMSGGNFTIRVDASDKHKKPFGILDMVKSAQYEMGHSASYYWKEKDINLLPFTTMPFGMTASEQNSWFYYGDGMALMQKAYAPHKLYAFPGGNSGTQMGGWFRKEIKTLDDLDGLRMRLPGFAGEVMATLGLKVANIAPDKLYNALETGAIDALEWVGPGMDINMGFHKIAPYYYTGWHEPAAELQFLVNIDKYNKLSDANKEILRVAMRTAAYDMYTENYYMSSEAWSQIKTDYPGIQVKTFPKEVMNAIRKANDKLIIQKAKGKPLLQETLYSQKVYMRKTREWTKMSDYFYLKSNEK